MSQYKEKYTLNERDVQPAKVLLENGWKEMNIKWLISEENMGCKSAVLFKAVEGVGTDRRAFAGREDQHLPGNGQAFQLVPPLYHHAALRIHTSIKGDAHRSDQGFACGLAGGYFSAGENHFSVSSITAR